MSIEIHINERGQRLPVAVCASCGERIERLHEGSYYWQVDALKQPVPGRSYLLHRNCAYGFTANKGDGGFWLWTGLRDAIDFVANNLGPRSFG